MYAIVFVKDRPKRKAKAHLISLNTRKAACGVESEQYRFTSKIGTRKDVTNEFLKMDNDCICGNCLKKINF